LLTGGSDKLVRLWNVIAGKEIRRFEGHTGDVRSLAVSADGERILSASGDMTVRLWDLRTGKELQVFRGHTDDINHALAFSPDGRLGVSGSADKTIRVWTLPQVSGEVVKTPDPMPMPAIPGVGSGLLLTFVSGSDTFVADAKPGERTWRMLDAKGGVLRTFEGHEAAITCGAVSPDRKTILTGSADKSVRLWDLATGKELHAFKGPANAIVAIAISPDGKTALTSEARRGMAHLWDLENRKPINNLGNGEPVVCVAFNPGGTQIACATETPFNASTGANIAVWSLSPIKQTQQVGMGRKVSAIAFSPDGATLLGSMEDRNLIEKSVDGKTAPRTFGENILADHLTFSADGKLVLVEAGREVRVYTYPAMKLQLTITQGTGDAGPYSACFDADNKAIVYSARAADGRVTTERKPIP
jgi:WD40 repeat protein